MDGDAIAMDEGQMLGYAAKSTCSMQTLSLALLLCGFAFAQPISILTEHL